MAERRFLIVTASIGSGHSKAAEAVEEELKKVYPKAFIRIVDFSAWDVSPATAFMKASYLFMLHFIPNLYNLMYCFTGGKAGGLSVQSLISASTARDIRALVRKYQPDVVICTHPFPAGAASWRKARHPHEFLFATAITDYSVHQMWIYPNVDRYFVAREAMKTDLAAAGLPTEHIYVTGIPIMEAFTQPVDRTATFRRLNLSPDSPVVLLMGGGLGLGFLESGAVPGGREGGRHAQSPMRAVPRTPDLRVRSRFFHRFTHVSTDSSGTSSLCAVNRDRA